MIRRRSGARGAALLAAFALWVGVVHAAAVAPDWPNVADVDTIEIVAVDTEGEPRERTIWLVVWEGNGYIRAGSTSSWDAGIDANPDVTIRIGERDYELRATRVSDPYTIEKVNEAFRDKYGYADAFAGLIRGLGGKPRVMRLDAARGMPME